MDKLGIKDETKYCQSICELTESNAINSLKKISDEIDVVELRIDYLLSYYNDIDKVIDIINRITKVLNNKKIMATIRTFKEGGFVNIDIKQYIKYIEKICENTKVDAVDIEYRYYLKSKKSFVNIINAAKKDIILSYHEFDKSFTLEEYKKLIENMSKECNIVKVAIKGHNRQEVIDIMDAGKEVSERYKKNKYIIISLGKLGILSRVNYEYTNTKIIFVNENDGINELGQASIKEYQKLRKLI